MGGKRKGELKKRTKREGEGRTGMEKGKSVKNM